MTEREAPTPPLIEPETLLSPKITPKAQLLYTLSISEKGTLYISPTLQGQHFGLVFHECPLVPVTKTYLKNSGITPPRKKGHYVFLTRYAHDLFVTVGPNGEYYMAQGAPSVLRYEY